MKKFLLALIAAGAMVLTGCNNLLDSENTKAVSSDREMVLASYALTGNYKTSEDEMIAAVNALLENDTARAASVSTLSVVEKKEIPAAFNNSKVSRDAEAEENVDMYVISLGDDGFALGTTDRRIGNVLALVEDGSYEEASEDPYWNYFTDRLNDYISETVEIWNNLSEEEVSRAAKAGNISRAVSDYFLTEGYTFKDVVYNSGNTSCILTTKWAQRAPYNTAIKNVYGKSYLAGCGAIATAQLIAFFEPQISMGDTYYANVKESYSAVTSTGWDGTYDWDAMKTTPSGYGLTVLGRTEMACMIYEVAERAKSSYGTGATTTYAENCSNTLKQMGLTHDLLQDYSYETVTTSIDNGSPMFIRGSGTSGGHAWVLDGYANLSATAYNSSDETSVSFTDNFVHCNPGWSGSKNGYYLSGVFEMGYSNGNIAESAINYDSSDADATGSENYYYKNIKIIPNIRIAESPYSTETLVSSLNPGYGYAVYFAGTFDESDSFQKAVRGTYDESTGKWICTVNYSTLNHEYSTYTGAYDLGETVQGAFENLTWEDGDNDLAPSGYNISSELNPGYGYAVYFTGTFDKALNWTRAYRGTYNSERNRWEFSDTEYTKVDYSCFEFKALTGSYDLGEVVKYTYAGLTEAK